MYHVFREKLYIILNTIITKGHKILEGDGTEGKMDGIIIKLRVKLALYFLELYPTLSSNFLMAKVKRGKICYKMNHIFQRKTNLLPRSNVVSPGPETREQCLLGVS